MVGKSKKTEEKNVKVKDVAEEKAEKTSKIKLSQTDYEKKVLELAEKGLTAEKIGEELRKQGVHSKEFDKKISKIFGDKYVNPDLKNVETKLERIKTHFEKNKQDKRAKREKDRVFSQLRKLKIYFKAQ